MKTIHRITLLLLPILFLSIFSGCKKESEKIVGGMAPDFTLNEITGKPATMASYRGKVVLLEFWATWCPPCQMATPDLIKLYEKYNSRGFELLAVSIDDSLESVKAFAAENKINYHVLFDDRGVNELYGVRSIPITFLIDKTGTIISKHNGYSPEMADELAKRIESLL